MQFSAISEGEPIPAYENSKSALVVIDIQEGITGKLSSSEGHAQQAIPFIKTVNQVIAKADSSNSVVGNTNMFLVLNAVR